ncbi:hypothetical protein ACQPW1_09070 [Nocardia sp. CA-128927]|uniref:hypothetical protein n=1 Tax=Nocardia sp. CA-128927 TaxID=3239975 RepID=UPI003D96A20B
MAESPDLVPCSERRTYDFIVGAATQQVLTLVGVLVGASATFTATALTERAKWQLENVALGRETSHQEYRQCYESVSYCRNDFYACARADRGIRSGDLRPGDNLWLPPDVSDLPASSPP